MSFAIQEESLWQKAIDESNGRMYCNNSTNNTLPAIFTLFAEMFTSRQIDICNGLVNIISQYHGSHVILVFKLQRFNDYYSLIQQFQNKNPKIIKMVHIRKENNVILHVFDIIYLNLRQLLPEKLRNCLTDVVSLGQAQIATGCFSGCISLKSIPMVIESWRIPTNCSKLFEECHTFNQPLVNFDTSHVTDMTRMFAECSAYNQPLIFDASNVTSTAWMLMNCRNFDSKLEWKTTGELKNMNGMFSGCISFDKPLDLLNTDNVTNMDCIFAHCYKFNQILPRNTYNGKCENINISCDLNTHHVKDPLLPSNGDNKQVTSSLNYITEFMLDEQYFSVYDDSDIDYANPRIVNQYSNHPCHEYDDIVNFW